MLNIVNSIYEMVGNMLHLPKDEDTPQKRVNKIFNQVFHNSTIWPILNTSFKNVLIVQFYNCVKHSEWDPLPIDGRR